MNEWLPRPPSDRALLPTAYLLALLRARRFLLYTQMGEWLQLALRVMGGLGRGQRQQPGSETQHVI
jgi:hypothetical protein